ncbi:hypothetical protein [Nocardia sp. NPDC051833]|uniref:hypothetical protein n=1 Tax=Nocardia sp. NPDC051833 TaxID=3155674 RepID=UPI00343EB5E4
MNITLTPAAITFMRATTRLDEVMESGAVVNINDLLDARAAAKATLVAEGFTPDEITALAEHARA